MMTEKSETLATIREVSDDLSERIHPVILEMDPPKAAGRKRVHPGPILDGIIFPRRTADTGTACPGNLGDDSTIYCTFQRWVELGVLERIWAELVAEYEELGGVDWEWQAAALRQAQDCHRLGQFWGIQQAAIPRIRARQAASGVSRSTGVEGH